MIEMNSKVRDKVTGFTGIVTAIAEHSTGSPRVEVSPQCKKDGSFINERWFDAARLVKFEVLKA